MGGRLTLRLALLALSALLLALAGCGGGGEELAEPGAEDVYQVPTKLTSEAGVTLTGWPLRVDTRSRLSVCVDGAAGLAISNADVEEVRQALDAGISTMSDPLPAVAEWQVSMGCPPVPNLLRHKQSGHVEPGFPATVQQPSEHTLFVYFWPGDLHEEISGIPNSSTTAERICGIRYSCYPVTAAAYVRDGASGEELYNAIFFSLGFNVGDGGADGFLAGRTRLSLCVDGAGRFEASGDDVERIRLATQRALGGVPRVPDAYVEYDVVRGCPPPTVELKSTERWENRQVYAGLNVDEPSPHRVFVYLMRPDDYAGLLARDAFATASAEYVCEGDVCHGVTPGLYLPTTIDDGALRKSLLRVLGLAYGPPNPDLDIDWSACERGELPHPDIACEQFDDWNESLEALEEYVLPAAP